MIDIKFRASSIAEIMADGKGADVLSVGAKTFLNGIAKEYVYGFRETIDTKYFKKGIECEQAAIDLYNNVFFTNHKKNETRLTNEWVTGECDILVPKVKVIDIKNAWSLPTFPDTADDVLAIAKKSGYDYQGHSYMALYDVDEFEVAYCMTTTPEDLRKWEQAEIHEVDHIDPALRVTRATIKRDSAIEAKMIAKVKVAQEYLKNRVAQIHLEHREAA